MELTLAETARRLGVSTRQAQRLAQEGKLQVVRQVGRSILVDDSGVAQRKRVQALRGRRWNAGTAWAAIELLECGSTTRVSGATLSRLKSRLAEISVEEFVRLSAGRARIQRFTQTRRRPAALEEALTLTGRSALRRAEIARRFGLAGGGSDIVEGYVHQLDCDAVIDRFGLVPHADGEVFLHVSGENAVESMTTVALDLFGTGSTRERSASREVLRVVLAG